MKNKGNVTPPKEHNNFPATDPKEIKTLILPGNCFKEAEQTTREKKKKKKQKKKTEKQSTGKKKKKKHMNKTCLIEK